MTHPDEAATVDPLEAAAVNESSGHSRLRSVSVLLADRMTNQCRLSPWNIAPLEGVPSALDHVHNLDHDLDLDLDHDLDHDLYHDLDHDEYLILREFP